METNLRYVIESCEDGWMVLDSSLQDGENCLVDGSTDKDKAEALCAQLNTHDRGEPCDEEKCQECCPHDERDHGICLDCEHEECPGRAIDRAMDYYEDR